MMRQIFKRKCFSVNRWVSRVRAYYVHQIMIAASVIAAMQMSALLSYRVWVHLQSLSLDNMFSTLRRCLYCVLQKVAGDLRRRFGGIQGV